MKYDWLWASTFCLCYMPKKGIFIWLSLYDDSCVHLWSYLHGNHDQRDSLHHVLAQRTQDRGVLVHARCWRPYTANSLTLHLLESVQVQTWVIYHQTFPLSTSENDSIHILEERILSSSRSRSRSRSGPGQGLGQCSSLKQTQNWSFRVKNRDLERHYNQMSHPPTHRHPPTHH